MGLSRIELWGHLGLEVKIVEPMLIEAYTLEAEREWRGAGDDSPHGARWHTSFHASAFPGEDPVACGRASVYTLMDLPKEKPFEPKTLAVFDVGTDLEHNWVRRFHSRGQLLTKSPAIGDAYQDVFIDDEHWLTGAADAIVLPPFWTRSHNVEIKTTCLSGDTLVAVADGRNAVSLRQLAEEGEPVDVYASDDGCTVVRKMRGIKKTRRNAEMVRVNLDDGSYVRCTPDHQFMLLDGSYRRADCLSPGTSLMRFDSRANKAKKDKAFRRQIWLGPRGPLRNENAGGRWRWQYKWSAERLFPDYSYHGTDGLVADHIDGNSLNDRYDNLQLMTRNEHAQKHFGTDEFRSEQSARVTSRWNSYSDEKRSEIGQKMAASRDQVATNQTMKDAYQRLGAEWLSERSRKAWETRRRRTLENHCVISVEPDGTEDTYCGTVTGVGNFAIVTSGENFLSDDLSGVVVHNSHEKVMAMRDNPENTPYSHAKYLRQIKTYIGLAYEQKFSPTVTLCKDSWAVTRSGKLGDMVMETLRWCPVHHSFDCETVTITLGPPNDGTLIYSSREEPLLTASYYVPLDTEHMRVGREKLALWRDQYLRDELPAHPHEGQRAKWTVSPCKYCDFKRQCKADYTAKTERISESAWIDKAKEIRPHYNYEASRARVLARWKEKVAA